MGEFNCGVGTVYAIVHKKTGRAYVGGTVGLLKKRIARHFYRLRRNDHGSIEFQSLYSQCPLEDWEVITLELCETNSISLIENKWISEYDKRGLLLNTVRGAHGNRVETHSDFVNLAVATITEYRRNTVFNSKSGYRGVRQSRWGTYSARIKVNGEVLRLGVFKTAEDAARAYNEKARDLFGNSAFQNSLP